MVANSASSIVTVIFFQDEVICALFEGKEGCLLIFKESRKEE
jgi:hypothetical protein